MNESTLGVALYFDPDRCGPITAAWVDGVSDLFARVGLPLECYTLLLTDDVAQAKFRSLPAERGTLGASLAGGRLISLELYGGSEGSSGSRTERCGAKFDLTFGYACLGLPASTGIRPGELLTEFHRLTFPVADSRYGIAYTRPGIDRTLYYARGLLIAPPGRPADPETAERIETWLKELEGERRHLRTHFRTAYPAQLVSEGHLAAELELGVKLGESREDFGDWTELPGGVWLWELGEGEMTTARMLMEETGLRLGA